MRWTIEKAKGKIVSKNFENHEDHLEESGKEVSAVIEYGVNNGFARVKATVVFPRFRIQQQNTTKAHLMWDVPFDVINGKFDKVEFDGNLHIYTENGGVVAKNSFYPSVEYPIFYERIEISNGSLQSVNYTFKNERIANRFCCEGIACIEKIADNTETIIEPGETKVVTIAVSSRYANQERIIEKNSYLKRNRRIRQLIKNCDITTGDNVLDTLAAFCRLRVGESIFKTKKGFINSPGGKQYYVGAWANDTSQYATPFFAYTSDKTEQSAAKTAMEYYAPFMSDSFEPIPSSIIVGGRDYWNMRRDRGDAAMFLSGNCRYFLNKNEIPSEKYFNMLKWCADYTERQITSDGVVFSDTDEMEYRLSAGINLSTSAIAFGAFNAYSVLLARMGKNEESDRIKKVAGKLAEAIERYFGATVSGYETYDYHKECGEMRAWDCLPSFYGIKDRTEATLKAIEDKLYREGEVYSCERKEEMWDRSGLYFYATLFRCGYPEKGYELLRTYSERRLLGEHVPYPIERIPEGYHLSDEGALYNRIFLDGMLRISYIKEGCLIDPILPETIKKLKIERIIISGVLRDITVDEKGVTVLTYGRGKRRYNYGEKVIL